MIRLSFLVSILSAIFGSPVRASDVIPQDQTAAVIIAYQRIADEDETNTAITPAQFAAHIEELKGGDYQVLPLAQIVAALKKGTSLPAHTVALTFDGAYRALLKNAVPILEQAQFPFTIFVATDTIDAPGLDMMSWADLKRLAHNPLVTIGLQPASGLPMTNTSIDEVRRQVNKAHARLRDMVGVDTTLFGYPFGQYQAADRAVVSDAGFLAAVGLQSGVAYAGTDVYSLPRFVMTGDFGDLDRFQMAANALPLPVTDLDPKAPSPVTIRPSIGFTISPALAPSLAQLNCFAAGQAKPKIERLGANRVELRLSRDLDAGTTRVNCTLPGPAADVDEMQRWRWFGLLLTTTASGNDEDDQPVEEMTSGQD